MNWLSIDTFVLDSFMHVTEKKKYRLGNNEMFYEYCINNTFRNVYNCIRSDIVIFVTCKVILHFHVLHVLGRYNKKITYTIPIAKFVYDFYMVLYLATTYLKNMY